MPTGAYTQDVTFQVDVGKYINVVMSYSSLYFGSLVSGTANNPVPNQLNGLYNASISTNANYSLNVNATDWDGGVGTFGVGNMTMDWNTTAGDLSVGNGVTMSISPALIHNNTIHTITREYHGFFLSIPADQTAGSYSSVATFTYANI